jgi:twitching motility protein PilT
LHIVAGRPALFRIAGELVASGEPLGPPEVEEMLKSIIPGRLLPSFERDGSCDFAIPHAKLGRFRVNVGRQRTGMKASLRLIGFEIPTLSTLGLPDAIDRRPTTIGAIALTGPTVTARRPRLAALVIST